MKEAFKLTYNKPLGKKKEKLESLSYITEMKLLHIEGIFMFQLPFKFSSKLTLKKNSENARQIFNTVRVLNMYL